MGFELADDHLIYVFTEPDEQSVRTPIDEDSVLITPTELTVVNMTDIRVVVQ